MITYVRYHDLVIDTMRLARQIPPDAAVIVGIPRSGMVPAAMLAAHLHLPLAEPVAFGLLGALLGGGHRDAQRLRPGPVVVVDDSCYMGRELRSAQGALVGIKREVITAVLYAHPDYENKPDMFVRSIPGPRFFEWNLFNHEVMTRSCLDFDGVLCVDPTMIESRDPAGYAQFIKTAEPLYVPRRCKVHRIVTHRRKKWHNNTAHWLKRHRVKCDRITMRRGSVEGNVEVDGTWKGRQYSADDAAELFVESDHRQAKRIYEVSGKPVICPTSGEVYQ